MPEPEAPMTDIAAIFALDPLKLTRDGPEMRALIAYYREKRAQFALGDKQAGATKKVAGAKPPKAPPPKLEDLGL